MKLLGGTLSLFRRRGTRVPAGRGTSSPTLGSLENSKGCFWLVMANNPGSSTTEGLLGVHHDLDVKTSSGENIREMKSVPLPSPSTVEWDLIP